ncbi:hypothetical protein FRC14_004814 [Serendipita sp. 396]|nr:hypothetical protein FRC14_004814 [Serendipita sp. 396]
MVHSTAEVVAQHERLENERLQLLKSIHDQSGNAYRLENRKGLNFLQNKYNQIVISQREARRGPWTDPLSILPFDIWVHIIEEIVDDGWGSSYRVIYNMILVSKQWKDAIVRIPQFWTQISIEVGFAESEVLQRITTALYLSGNQALTLDIERPIGRDLYDGCHALLAPHSARIRRITFRQTYLSSSWSGSGAISLYQILLSLLPLPNLQDLRLSDSNFTEDQWGILESMPRIRFLEGGVLPLSIVKHVSLVNLETLAVSGRADELFIIMTYLPRLRRLTIMDPSRSVWGWEDDAEVPSDGYRVPPPEQPLALEVLTWQKRDASRLQELLGCSPRLKQLTLWTSWKTLGLALGDVNKLPFLSNTSVNMQWVNSGDKFSSSTVTQNTSIRELSLNFTYCEYKSTKEYQIEQDTNISRLIHSWLPTLEQVDTLSILVGSQRIIPFTFLSSLRYLRVLHLVGAGFDDNSEFPELTLNALEDLRLNHPLQCYNDFLSSLRCPSLLLLILQIMDFNHATNMTLRLPSLQFPRLSSLYWKIPQAKLEISPHMALKSISFSNGASQAAGDFCTYLILRPRDFPSLETVKFYQFPEWDLLFLMLERRNFLLDQSISKITKVFVPTTLGLVLKEPLTSLLGGQFTNRLSNHELSISGMGEIYFDKSLPGCHWCCLSMQACSSPVISMPYPLSLSSIWSEDRAELPIVNPDPPLADHILDWLSQRQTRYDKWKASAEDFNLWTRERVCGSHELDSAFIFSEFSTSNPSSYRSVATATLESVFD